VFLYRIDTTGFREWGSVNDMRVNELARSAAKSKRIEVAFDFPKLRKGKGLVSEEQDLEEGALTGGAGGATIPINMPRIWHIR
jgi:hypothetical protein